MNKKIIADIYPLSPTQEGMLYHYLHDANSEEYFEQLCIELEGELDAARFANAWNWITEKHPALRTIFRWEGVDKPLQVVLKSRQVKIDWRILSDTPDLSAALTEILVTDRQTGFDLARGPLFRVIVCEFSRQRYAVIWSFHHIILDGWSTGILWKELFQVYTELPAEVESAGSSVSYKDYIQFIEKQDSEQGLRYWREYLQGYTAPVSLALRRPAVGEKAKLCQSEYEFSFAESEELRNIAKKYKSTVNILLQLAWGLLLQKYTSTTDVVFGGVVAGRPFQLTGIEETVGLFINTLPVRIKLEGDKTAGELLTRLLQENFRRQVYEHLSLAEIKAQSEIRGTNPLFDNIIIFENYPIDETLNSMDIGLKVLRTSYFELTNFPLTITAFIIDKLKLRCSYDRNLYDLAAIEQMMGHLKNLLTAIAANPDIPARELEMLTSEERLGLLNDCNGAELPYPQTECVHELFEAQVKRTPDVVALVYGSTKLTYHELNCCANILAREIRQYGVKADSIIGIMVDRSLEMVISMLAILKAGCAYIPLDPHFPTERLAYMLTDSEAQLLLSQQNLTDKVTNYQGKVIQINLGLAADGSLSWRGVTDFASEQCANLPAIATAQSLAYVLYTSGSTGKPKGIQIEHQSVVNLIQSLSRTLPFTAGRKFLALTTISFDISVLELFLTLCSGLEVIIAGSEAQRDPQKLGELIEQYAIELMQMTPSTAQMLLSTDFTNSTLEALFLGGEPLPVQVIAQLQTRCKARIYNMYGPTETTVWSSYAEVKSGSEITLGKPIHHTRIYLLDNNLHPVPIGVMGEIYIAGRGLARGYLNRPELTAERFLPDPFKDGEKMYRTGDLGLRTADGSIEFHGRVDNQVKVRGFRIEIGEIEAAILQHSGIRECAVTALADGAGDKFLAGYLVPALAEGINPQELRAKLGGFLPDYMVPATFVMLEKLPLTTNGKIDRKALPALTAERVEAEYVAPRSVKEVELTKIWAEVLERERVGVYDNFFELGGHSLKLTRVLARIRKNFAVQLSLQTFFKNPTIAGIAAEIDQLEKKAHLQIKPQPPQPYYPVSLAQKRLWVLERLSGGTAVYNMPSAFLLKGKLEIAALQQAFNTVVQRHEILRTGIRLENGVPVQIVQEDFFLEIPVFAVADEGMLPEIIEAEAVKPFDLNKPGLLRVTLYKIDEGAHLILLTIHHIISDEWSSTLLITEVARLYDAYCQGKVNPLQPLSIQYRDFAIWQNAHMESGGYKADEEYWLTHLQGELPLLNLPTDYPRPAVLSYSGGEVEFTLKDELAARLNQFAKERSTTLFMVLLTGYYAFLHHYTRQHDLIVGTAVAGREDEDVESLIGFFVNTLPLRMQILSEESFADLLKRVEGNVLEAFHHQSYPFDLLVNRLQVKRDPARSPVIETLFNLINLGDESQGERDGRRVIRSFAGVTVETAEGLAFEPVKQTNKIAKFDLTLSILYGNGRLKCLLEYSTDLFKTETIEAMARYLADLLQAVVTNPTAAIPHLKLFPLDAQTVVPIPVVSPEVVASELEEFYQVAPYVAPRNELEAKIATIWQEILGVEKVGIEDSFFNLGGNSFSIILLYERLKELVDIPFTVASLFSYHSIGMFTEYLSTLQNKSVMETTREDTAVESEVNLDDLFTKLASGDLTPEEAAKLFTGGESD